MTVKPAARAARAAAVAVATGISNCSNNTSLFATRLRSAVSSRDSRPLASGATTMMFSPLESTITTASGLYTPSIAASILNGITRDTIMTLARDLAFKVVEGDMPREFLYLADEVFFVGTAAEVTPIRSIDKITIGQGRRGPITEALQRAFFDVVNCVVPDTHGWLTWVYPEEAALRQPVHAGTAKGR